MLYRKSSQCWLQKASLFELCFIKYLPLPWQPYFFQCGVLLGWIFQQKLGRRLVISPHLTVLPISQFMLHSCSYNTQLACTYIPFPRSLGLQCTFCSAISSLHYYCYTTITRLPMIALLLCPVGMWLCYQPNYSCLTPFLACMGLVAISTAGGGELAGVPCFDTSHSPRHGMTFIFSK